MAAEDAGAASGLINVAHQLGSALGLGLTTAIAAPGGSGLRGTALTPRCTHHGLMAATLMLAIALALVLGLTVKTDPAMKGETR